MPKKKNDTANEMLQKVKRALTESIHWRETGGRGNKQRPFDMYFLSYSTKTRTSCILGLRAPINLICKSREQQRPIPSLFSPPSGNNLEYTEY